MSFRATILIEVDINTTDASNAAGIAHNIAVNMPNGCRLMEKPDITLRELRQVDRQMVTHFPNHPKDRLTDTLSNMSEAQQLIVSLCVTPQYSHVVYSALRKVWPTIPLDQVSKQISDLKRAGWLEMVSA